MSPIRAARRWLPVLVGLPVLLGIAPAPAAPPAPASGPITLETVSNRADLVSDGDVRVAVTLPGSTSPEELSWTLDGEPIDVPLERSAPRRWTGVVTGLSDGENELSLRPAHGPGRSLTVTNHPRGGPIFSGDQVQPWRCQTEEYGLGPAADDLCNATAVHTDVTLEDGSEAKLERGTLNRGIYDLVVPENWNHKLVWVFGAGTGQHYRQGTPATLVSGLDAPVEIVHARAADALARGFAVASSTMTDNSQHSNDVTSAETVMMLQEHVGDSYGELRYTIGMGASGGALQQYLIADAYPGLLDGLLPTLDWQDQIVGAYREFGDCAALVGHMQDSPLWAERADRVAVFGHGGTNVCDTSFGRAPDYMAPDDGTDCAGEASFDAQTRPNGVRCTLQDFMVSIYGVRDDGCDGHGIPCARRPWDNVGVQYGLRALTEGRISPAQFVDLNAGVGGFDINMNPTATRSAADVEAVKIAHRTGRVVFGRGLASVPIIVERGTDNDDYHYPWRSYVMRNRLDRANGHHENQVLWTNGTAETPLVVMERWLDAVTADPSKAPTPVKVRRHRPAVAVDTCWIDGEPTTDVERCEDAFPVVGYGDTRVAAGEVPTSDLLKCQLKPLERDDYSVAFTEDQWDRLQTTFPSGVCDARRPGVGQSEPGSDRLIPPQPWVSFSGGPGGEPLGQAPVAVVDR